MRRLTDRQFGAIFTVLVLVGGVIAARHGYAPWLYACLVIATLTITLYVPHWMARPKRYSIVLGEMAWKLKSAKVRK